MKMMGTGLGMVLLILLSPIIFMGAVLVVLMLPKDDDIHGGMY